MLDFLFGVFLGVLVWQGANKYGLTNLDEWKFWKKNFWNNGPDSN